MDTIQNTAVYQDCLRLFIEQQGRNIVALERTMRSLGHPFHRRILYTRTEKDTKKPGWIDRFKWREKLPSLRRRGGGASPTGWFSPGRNASVNERGEREEEIHPQMDTDKHRSDPDPSSSISVHQCSSVDENSSSQPSQPPANAGGSDFQAPGRNASVNERGEREEEIHPQMDTDKHRSHHDSSKNISVHQCSSVDKNSSSQPPQPPANAGGSDFQSPGRNASVNERGEREEEIHPQMDTDKHRSDPDPSSSISVHQCPSVDKNSSSQPSQPPANAGGSDFQAPGRNASVNERGERAADIHPQMGTDKHGSGSDSSKAISVHQCSSVDENQPPANAGGSDSDDFHAWLKRVSKNMTWDWKHQQVVIEKLKAVTEGRCKRLMIFMPPRHGKSELVTVRYSAYRMLQDPSMNIILGSYNQDLANRFSRKVRRVIADSVALEKAEPPASAGGKESANINVDPKRTSRSPACSPPAHAGGSASPMFPFASSRPANRVSEWETAAGGGFRAVGVGSGVTGFGANLIVIDDPVKNRAQAESIAFRNRAYDWYTDDISTRLEPDGAMILIQTRWHEDDLAGRILRDTDEHNLEKWDVVSLPALAEPGRNASVNERGEREEETHPQMDTDKHRSGSDSSNTISVHQCSSVDDNSSFQPSSDILRMNPGRNASVNERGERAEDHPQMDTDKHRSEPDLSKAISVHLCSSVDENSEILKTASSQPSEPPAYAGGTDLLDWRSPGEALCPERFDVEALELTKRRLGSYSFSALFQQQPSPSDGGIFKREWFKIIPFAPAGLKWARGYDLAIATHENADYTASLRCAFDEDGNLYIADGFRDRIDFPAQRRYVLERIRAERDTIHGIEKALHGQALVSDLRHVPEIRGEALLGVSVAADKITRALAWSPVAEEGKCFLVSRVSSPHVSKGSASDQDEVSVHLCSSVETYSGPGWIRDFLEEVAAFPVGTNDDQIDAVSLAIQLLKVKRYKAGGF